MKSGKKNGQNVLALQLLFKCLGKVVSVESEQRAVGKLAQKTHTSETVLLSGYGASSERAFKVVPAVRPPAHAAPPLHVREGTSCWIWPWI